MTQSIIIQVGQCGNQVGCRFWDLALREHANVNKMDFYVCATVLTSEWMKETDRTAVVLGYIYARGIYDEAMSSFFRNVDTRNDDCSSLPVGDGLGRIFSLRARVRASYIKAVMIDMEEGVVSEIMNGPLRELFDHRQLITDVSGSGNNWAVGHHEYGRKYHERISESIRRAAEQCDSLQCFFVLHSMGGGTGSGVRTYVLQLLKDEYPEVYCFVVAVFPSDDDDVVTSPYNSLLALHQITLHADCVFPIENQALIDIVNKITQALPVDRTGKRIFGPTPLPKHRVRESSLTTSEGGVTKKSEEKPFDGMNNIVANLLLNLTSSARFEGSLNVDLNEITMNLVPFPRMHYIVSSQTPLYSLFDVKIPSRRLDQMFLDAFSQGNQLIKSDPRHGLYIACALLVRGQVEISDIRRNIERLQSSLRFIAWNKEGWKTGLCSVAPVGHPYSLLTLANNSCIWNSFQNLKDRFNKLYRRKAHICHYTRTEGMEEAEFGASLESITSVINEYKTLEKQSSQPYHPAPRLQIST